MTNEQQPYRPPAANYFEPQVKRMETETDPVPAILVQQMQEPIRTSRDRAQYVRNQKGHSLTLWILFGGFVLWIPAIYFSLSPNHYWHA